MTTTNLELDRDSIGRIDSTDQLTDVLAIPEHLRDALWKAESAQLERVGQPRAAWSSRAWAARRWAARSRVPRSATGLAADPRRRGLRPAAWTTPDTTVLCATYSGDTEETLAAYEAAGRARRDARRRHQRRQAGRAGARRRRAGHPDRRRVAAARGRRLHHASPRWRSPRCAAPARAALRHRRRGRAPRGARRGVGARGAEDSEAKALARGAARDGPGDRRRRPHGHDRLPLEDAAQRERQDPGVLRTSCPRLDHNELVGWSGAAELGRFSAVFLDDSDMHPRIAERVELTAGLIRDAAAQRSGVATRGTRRSSASSRSCCSAISCRSTTRPCAAWIPGRSS